MAAAVLLASMSGAPAASAHGDGASWETPVGQYVVDVGYEPDEFTAGETTRFDFNLKQGSGEDAPPVPFAEVWVRLKGTDLTYLATGVRKQTLGPTTLLYTFVKPGDYSFEVSFRDESGKEAAAASFPVTVAAGEMGATSSLWLVYFAPGLVFGVVLASLFSIIRKLRRS